MCNCTEYNWLEVFQGVGSVPSVVGVEMPRCELGISWYLLFHALLNIPAPWRGQGVCEDPRKRAHVVPLAGTASELCWNRAGTLSLSHSDTSTSP